MRTHRLLVGAAALALGVSGGSAAAQDLANLQTIASGMPNSLYMTVAPGDPDRLFVVQQGGSIRVIENGTLLAQDFLDIDAIVACCGERGLLGLAFSPNYQTDGAFFVNYINNSGDTVIARYEVTANPNIADAGSADILLTIDQDFANHNGGCIQFGPDGFLYIGMGDGGSANDPRARSQDNFQLLGKMLRIDVISTPGDYEIPEDNPLGDLFGLDEIWANGLRNPWRFSFDRATGDLYIGDVGQNAREEVNVTTFPFNNTELRNYGWRCMEGTRCTGLSGCTCNGPDLILPDWEYNHGTGFSITGGYVYRGDAIPRWRGRYFVADFVTDRVWSWRYIDGQVIDVQSHQGDLADGGGGSVNAVASFAEDADGELYIVQLTGQLRKIVPEFAATDWTLDGVVNAADVGAFLGDYFADLGSKDISVRADFDGNGQTNAADVGDFLSRYFQDI